MEKRDELAIWTEQLAQADNPVQNVTTLRHPFGRRADRPDSPNMLSLLFWNLQKKDLSDSIVRICQHNEVDIAIFAECTLDRQKLAERLSGETHRKFLCPFELSEKLSVVSSMGENRVTTLQEDYSSRLSIYRIALDDGPLLLCAAHLQSQYVWEPRDQGFESTRLANDILQVENSQKISRTVLIGDLNMDPFSDGVVAAHGLHAVMSRRIAARESRIVSGKGYRFFYNPMWGVMGDRSPGPAGTYYYDGSKPLTYFWHTFDQILVRPELAELVQEIRILDSDGIESLVDRNDRPRADRSDHLPLFARLAHSAEKK